MADERIGRQTPTVSVVLPYEETRGGEAVLLYNQSSKKALEWQELMMYDIMAVNPNSTWRHMKFGWSVPRQNGKSELLIMRAIWGLLHDERVLYTAHVVNTSHSAWEKTVPPTNPWNKRRKFVSWRSLRTTVVATAC